MNHEFSSSACLLRTGYLSTMTCTDRSDQNPVQRLKRTHLLSERPRVDGEAPVAGGVHERAAGRPAVCCAGRGLVPGLGQSPAAAAAGHAAAATVKWRPTAAICLEAFQDPLSCTHGRVSS